MSICLDAYVAYAKSAGKPLLAAETCWGNQDDPPRVEIIRTTLKHLKQRGIGYLVYLLHHSLMHSVREHDPVSIRQNASRAAATGSVSIFKGGRISCPRGPTRGRRRIFPRGIADNGLIHSGRSC